MAFSFYWHDYETFGANPSEDWPCQFAGVRTDADLNIIGQPLVEYCRPPADYIPKPQACLVTGITPQLARDKGLPEPEFIKRIHHELAQAGTCGVGYNSIRFDDEITRYSLYRNFYDPYAREWQHGNSRWDIIDVVRMTYALRPEGITWPLGDNGQPSFKLERLTAANGLSHEDAHDALSDVYATIDFAKLLKTAKPRLFDYALSLRQKKTVLSVINLAQVTPFIHVSSKYPASQGCCAVVMPIGVHPGNPNGIVVIDLAQHPSEWASASIADIQRRLYTSQAELGDEARIALKTIHINKSPMVATIKLLDDPQAQRLGIDLNACRRHWQALQKLDQTSIQRLLEALRPEQWPEQDVDQQLYNGFIDNADKQLLTQVQRSRPEDLLPDNFAFTDKRLPELLFRYKARHWPHALTEAERARWQQHCLTRLEQPNQPHAYSLEHYFQEIEQLLQAQPSARDTAILEQLQHYGDDLLAAV